MDYTTERRDTESHLHINGTFTFSDNQKFREILSLLQDDSLNAVTLNIQNLQFIDSAALGMLLLLHDEAQKRDVHITLNGADGQIKKMLQLSNFDEIFTIHYA